MISGYGRVQQAIIYLSLQQYYLIFIDSIKNMYL